LIKSYSYITPFHVSSYSHKAAVEPTTSHAPPKHDAGCNSPRIQLRWDNPSAWNRSGAIPGGNGSTSVAAIAKRHTLPMVVGMAERGVAPNGTQALWDTAVLFDSDGSILGKHRKINILSELMTKPCADPTPFFLKSSCARFHVYELV